MYSITINSPVKTDLSIQIHNTPFGMPIAFYLGVGSKKNSYKNWLNKKFSVDPTITKSLVELHYLASYNKGVNFITNDKRSKSEAEVIKEFLETNEETLTNMLSFYNLPKLEQKVLENQEKILEQIEKQQAIIDSIPVKESN